jgi:hypothetical protein
MAPEEDDLTTQIFIGSKIRLGLFFHYIIKKDIIMAARLL